MSLITSGLKRVGLGAGAAAVGTYAVDAAMMYSTYKGDRASGHNKLYSAAHTVASQVLFNEFMVPMMALSLAPLAGVVHQAYQQRQAGLQRQMMPMGGNPVIDSQAAQTSRQRSLQAIQQARMSARNALGNEASIHAPRFR